MSADPNRSQPPGTPERAVKSARDELRNLLTKHWVMTLASSEPDTPYCTPLFPYAIGQTPEELIFVSDSGTRHGEHLRDGARVAAAVYRETHDVTRIEGVQMLGFAEEIAIPEQQSVARDRYLQRFPQAAPFLTAATTTRFYRLRIEWAKITDNARGFGFKIVYQAKQ